MSLWHTIDEKNQKEGLEDTIRQKGFLASNLIDHGQKVPPTTAVENKLAIIVKVMPRSRPASGKISEQIT